MRSEKVQIVPLTSTSLTADMATLASLPADIRPAASYEGEDQSDGSRDEKKVLGRGTA
jgi:hypothetical protein